MDEQQDIPNQQPEAADQPPGSSPNFVDALPDEILVMILSHISDGITLLDSVPLVCRRWCRLSRDRRSWARVDLDIQNRFWFHKESNLEEPTKTLRLKELEEIARVLLHAPALRLLRLSWLTVDLLPQQHTILSAARRSRAVIGALEMSECSLMVYEACQVFYELLWRSREGVRSLTFELPLEPRETSDESDAESSDSEWGEWPPPLQQQPAAGNALAVAAAEQEEVSDDAELVSPCDVYFTLDLDGHSFSSMDVLASLQRLEYLNVVLHTVFTYAGELENVVLPCLRRLELRMHGAEFGPRILAAHLIKAGAGTLLHIEAGQFYEKMAPVVAREIAQCKKLRSLIINLLNISVVENLTSLRSLEVGLNRHEAAATLRDVNAVRRFLARERRVLQQLPRLQVRFYGGLAVPSARQLLADVLSATPNVTKLTLSLRGNLLLNVDFCSVSDLTVLPGLKRFCAFLEDEDEDDFVDEGHLRQVIEDVKQKWPHVNFKLESPKF